MKNNHASWVHWNNRLHAWAAKQVGIDKPHELVHDRACERFGVKSTRELTHYQMEELYYEMSGQPKKTTKAKPTDPASGPQLYKINQLRPEAGLGDDVTYRFWLANSLRIFRDLQALGRLDRREAGSIIEALKSMSKRWSKNASAHGVRPEEEK